MKEQEEKYYHREPVTQIVSRSRLKGGMEAMAATSSLKGESLTKAEALDLVTKLGARSVTRQGDRLNMENVAWGHREATTVVADLSFHPDPVPVNHDANLRVGVYLLLASTGEGKTVVSASLVAMANALGTPATYFSVYEPRSPKYPSIKTVYKAGALRASLLRSRKKRKGVSVIDAATITEERQLFSAPESFLDDLESVLIPRTSPNTALIVCDSVTDAIPAYLPPGADTNTRTFVGGMQPSDRAWTVRANTLAKEYNVCLVFPINLAGLPYADKLTGVTEGEMRIGSSFALNRQDRSEESKRRAVKISIPEPIIAATIRKLGMGEYTKQSASDKLRYVSGVANLTS